MKMFLDGSVGDPKKGAANFADDVRTVQGYLNIQIIEARGSDPFLHVAHYLDDDTLIAIKAFQQRLIYAQSHLPGQSRKLAPSGVIEPRDATWLALSQYPRPDSMSMSQDARDWLRGLEGGFKPYPYPDQKKHPNATIGYGHMLHRGPVTPADREKYKNGIPLAEAERTFSHDVGTAEHELNANRNIEVPLTQNQFDALVSLIFNTGAQNFRTLSPIRRMLNDGDYLGAAAEIRDWPGDSIRHAKEQARFLTR